MKASNSCMKRLAAFTSVALTLAVAGCLCAADAQRGGSRGGFSRGGASSSRSGFTSSAHFAAAPSYHYAGGAFATGRPSIAPSLARPSFYSRRPVSPPVIRYRRPFVRNGVGIPYGYYGVSGWVATDYPGYYPDAASYYDGSAAQPEPPAYYGEQPYQGPPPPEYAPRPSEPPQPRAPLADEDAVTLVFKDGRPPQQIHNYALTRTMLYVRDQHHQDIPVDQLDLAATQKANQNSGVDFQLPVSAN